MLDQLPVVLVGLGATTTWAGDFDASAALIAESDAVTEATGTRAPPFAALMLPALRGDEATAIPLIEATITAATAGGQGLTVGYANWVTAILYNGLGRYSEALTAAQQASEDVLGALFVSLWALPELIEAAVRSGNTHLAAEAMANLAESTPSRRHRCSASGSKPAHVHCSATARPPTSSTCEAIERLSRTHYRPDLGRAHLLYGEWLLREDRLTEARTQLHAAHDLLSAIGAEAFAERARRELQATGERVLKRSVETVTTLTAQEALIARLARDGRTNPEIAAQLFLSARTVQYHLRKVFAKLGITSRRELHHALGQLRA